MFEEDAEDSETSQDSFQAGKVESEQAERFLLMHLSPHVEHDSDVCLNFAGQYFNQKLN